MPIDVSYAPFPRSLPGWANGPVAPMGSGSFMPGTGPARAVECLPAPNTCLPNGLRNPWAPYSGGAYQPASVAATNQQIHQATGGSIAFGGGGGVGGSVITPSHLVGAGATGSIIAPSVAGSVLTGVTGGMRDDDGWNGARGRDHRGIEPDMASTSGALGPIASSATTSWMASSPANHIALSGVRYGSPSPLVLAQSSPRLLPGGYGQPAESVSLVRPRRHSIRPAMFGNGSGSAAGGGGGSVRECPDCASAHIQKAAAPAGCCESPYRKVGHIGHGSPARGSPLRPDKELPLSRKVSQRSHRSGGTPVSRHCSECSGT